jgi:hypothetical protein
VSRDETPGAIRGTAPGLRSSESRTAAGQLWALWNPQGRRNRSAYWRSPGRQPQGVEVMNASELINQLRDLTVKHGDLPIQDEWGKDLDSVEYNDDDGQCFLISMDKVDD